MEVDPILVVLPAAVSLAVTLLLVWAAGHGGRLFPDAAVDTDRKFHHRPVPRAGGLALALAIAVTVMWMVWDSRPQAHQMAWLMVCGLPAFAAGLAEDLTGRVSPRLRLWCSLLSGALGVWLVEAVVSRSGLPLLDALIGAAPMAIFLTLVVVGGMAHAINIIDGFNGLASMCSALILAAMAYVALQVGDLLVLSLALACLGAIVGFFVFNYPAGLIFLGDGGAYLLGFCIAELGLLLVHRNEAVSPMFAFLVCIYPIFETAFSMYRRKVVRKTSSMLADGIHLHSLIYRRLMRWAAGDRTAQAVTRRNSMTSPYLWALCTLSVVPAVLFWRHTGVLLAFIVLFGVTYVSMYVSIVRFRTPRWMVVRGRVKGR